MREMQSHPEQTPVIPDSVSFREALGVWLRIGVLSFGGPAAQIALMHDELVTKRRWVDEARFLHALSYCTMLPGPEAQQLATYLGWLLHRTPGGLAAGSLFILPGALVMLAASIAYVTLRDIAWVSGLFHGLKAVVLAIVVEALVRVGKRALRTRAHRAIAAVSFVSLFFFDVPFPLVVVFAALAGGLGRRWAPRSFPGATHGEAKAAAPSLLDRMEARGELAHAAPSTRRAAFVLALALTLWALPFVVAASLSGTRSVYFEEASFFSQVAMVTFGGAYAVLTYVAQRAVGHYGWLSAGEMVQGLGLAETTPGPLILVVQFVGFLGAYHDPGPLPPLVAGALASLVTLWVTFVPCFLWIFLGAPFVEALRKNATLSASLAAITASVVGVILNLSAWFCLHVLFRIVSPRTLGPVRLLVPDLASIDVTALGIALVGALCLFGAKLGVARTLAVGAALGVVARLAGL